jgi:prolyl-tRNA editing enzyme YbaK/EbsC (Cys-tRNA(Pro) deacylase)
VPVVIDPLVLAHRKITFAAGRQHESVEAATDEVFTGASITLAPISRPLTEPGSELLQG